MNPSQLGNSRSGLLFGPFHNVRLPRRPGHGQGMGMGSRNCSRATGESAGGAGGGIKGGGGSGGGGGGGGGSKGSFGWFGAVWAAYLKQLDVRPMTTKMWTSGVLNAFGDVTSQCFIEKDSPFDYKRLAIFSFLGVALVGPVLHCWYGVLSRIFTTPGARSAFGSLGLDQFAFAPAFCGLFLSSLLTLEGNYKEIPAKLKQDWASVVLMNWKIWIPAQLFNFWLVPPNLRVLCANITALVWNTYLSFVGHVEIKQLENEQAEDKQPQGKGS